LSSLAVEWWTVFSLLAVEWWTVLSLLAVEWWTVLSSLADEWCTDTLLKIILFNLFDMHLMNI
jgi:hypothetical protein